MSDRSSAVSDHRDPAQDDEAAREIVLSALAERFPEGVTVLELASELSEEGADWVERAVRDLAGVPLVQCQGGKVFASFGIIDPDPEPAAHAVTS